MNVSRSPRRAGFVARAVLSVILSAGLWAAETPIPLTFDVAPTQAAPLRFTVGGRTLPLGSGGGFQVLDASTKAAIPLAPGKVSREARAVGFDSVSGELRLHATFTPVSGRVDVRGEIENLRGGERGVILEYRIPRWSAAECFSSSLDKTYALDGAKAPEENAYPLAAVTDATAGIGLAIPPSEPCVFGLAGDRDGLVLRFYLGLSPAPRRFPNRAAFGFTVYGVDPREGFRSALARYYAFFPDYYARRLMSDGLWMFQMGDRVPPNVAQYGFDEIEPQSPALGAAMARDTKNGIPMFPYIIVGQREIKFLPELPRTYDATLQALQSWRAPATHEISKEDVSAEMTARLKDEIESSACATKDGRYAMVLRNTTWGGNSVTFKVNPNPALFEGENRATVGADALGLVPQWLQAHPEFAGVYVDSLGANWPATLNYRKDHFVYAKYPLTVDPAGHVALQNDISHYEFLEALRALLRPSNRYLFGNGIYAYRSRGEVKTKVEIQTFDNQLNEFAAGGAPPEHWHPGARLGRFFDAALLDVAGSEAGVNANIERCQDARVFMGRKPYAFLNYRWESAEKVEEFINKSLSYAIFATSSKNFMTGVEYENNPQGYYRDKKLIDWFVPLARMLSRAGWEPVRHAEVTGRQLVCERYGNGPDVYYALYNDLDAAQSCTIRFDAAALGFRPGEMDVTEIARQAKVALGNDSATIELPSKKTCILKVTARP